MGNTPSAREEIKNDWWGPKGHDDSRDLEAETRSNGDTPPVLSATNQEKLRVFKEDLQAKHVVRREIIAQKKREIDAIRDELVRLRKENQELRSGRQCQTENSQCTTIGTQTVDDQIGNTESSQRLTDLAAQLEISAKQIEEMSHRNRELRICLAETQKELQTANGEIATFETKRSEYEKHVLALKDVIRVSKELMKVREDELKELKAKISEIEATLADKETSLLANNLRKEYEKQMENIRNLKILYEERQRVARAEKTDLKAKLVETTAKFKGEQRKNKELQERVQEAEQDISSKYDSITTLQSNLGLATAESRELKSEINVINQLFSQILLGFNTSQEIDLDRLIKLLEENHDLLTNMVINEESTEIASALPKVLLDLINQVNEVKNKEESETEEAEVEERAQSSESVGGQMNSAEEIVNNLPKVWKILSEFLSHQVAPTPNGPTEGDSACYKSVQTPSGTRNVISVSKTFIRLKDLILEKKYLEKEMGRLKQLNTHLETKLQDQEKRLETVSTELNKTWHVVDRMQRQHQQLHTHEKILRYELAQKRITLNELKEELERCRTKCIKAREKNSSTEEQWRVLRNEFRARRIPTTEDLNVSGESGYSDEREGSSDDEGDDEADISESLNPAISPQSEASEDLQIIPEADEEDGKEKTDEVEGEATTPPDSKEADAFEVLNADIRQQLEQLTSSQGTSSSEEAASSAKTLLEQQEERFARRDERLKMLEEQCQQLVTQVSNTNTRSEQITTKLETLHEQYGGESSQKGEPSS